MSDEKKKEKEKEFKKAELKKELMRFQESVTVQLKKVKEKKEKIEQKLEE